MADAADSLNVLFVHHWLTDQRVLREESDRERTACARVDALSHPSLPLLSSMYSMFPFLGACDFVVRFSGWLV